MNEQQAWTWNPVIQPVWTWTVVERDLETPWINEAQHFHCLGHHDKEAKDQGLLHCGGWWGGVVGGNHEGSVLQLYTRDQTSVEGKEWWGFRCKVEFGERSLAHISGFADSSLNMRELWCQEGGLYTQAPAWQRGWTESPVWPAPSWKGNAAR